MIIQGNKNDNAARTVDELYAISKLCYISWFTVGFILDYMEGIIQVIGYYLHMGNISLAKHLLTDFASWCNVTEWVSLILNITVLYWWDSRFCVKENPDAQYMSDFMTIFLYHYSKIP